MKRLIRRVRKASQELHRNCIMWAMSNSDGEYISTMNSWFELLDRLQEEVGDE